MRSAIVAVLAGAVLSACSPALAGPFHDLNPGMATAGRTAAARATLQAVISDRDSSGLVQLLADDVMLALPGGLERHGRAAVSEWIAAVAMPSAAGRVVQFDLAHTRVCAGGLHDLGMLLVAAGKDPSPGWHVALLWRDRAEGPLLAEVRVYQANDYLAYRRPCVPVPDSLFRAKRQTLTLSSGAAALVYGGLALSFADGLAAAGWTAPLDEVVGPGGELWVIRGSDRVTRRRLPVNSASLRRDVGKGFFVAAGAVVDGAFLERSDAAGSGTASLDYDIAAVALQVGISPGWLHVGVGPVAARASGTWHTRSVLTAGSPPADREWSNVHVGWRAEAGVLIPVSSRFGLALDLYQNQLPEVRIPGYLGMTEAGVSLQDAGLTAGFAVRL